MIVKTQKELDAALAAGADRIVINSPHGVWLSVEASGSATVEAYDSATVEAYDSATVEAYGSATVRAYGSATVEAYDSATVRASDSATVEAYGSATVEAYDSATVKAYDSATVKAYDSATVRATPYVAVHLFSARVTHEGGVIIDVSALDRSDWSTWAHYWGVDVTTARDAARTELIVYKAVDADLKSGHGFAYPVGETVTAPVWEPGDFCGNGLHLSPRPYQARSYFTGAVRFLECAVNVEDVSILDGNGAGVPKLKARRVRVIREVNIDGEAI